MGHAKGKLFISWRGAWSRGGAPHEEQGKKEKSFPPLQSNLSLRYDWRANEGHYNPKKGSVMPKEFEMSMCRGRNREQSQLQTQTQVIGQTRRYFFHKTVHTSPCFIHESKGSPWLHMSDHISHRSFIALLCEPGWAQITAKPPGGQTRHPKE